MEYKEPSADHLKCLRDRFGCREFKKYQWETIRSIMYDRRDTSIVASTGFGKSLIYQFPPVFFKDRVAIVVSPLIALMQDQVDGLNEKGIKATYYCSLQPDKSIHRRFGEFNVVYITPESLLHVKYIEESLKNIQDKICLFAIDEAHVVQSWSDFRPDFKDLFKIRAKFPNIPIVTLTATCPHYVERVINTTLRLDNPFSLRTTLNRPNLYFEVHHKISNTTHDYLKYIQDHVKNHPNESAIMYVIRRADAEEYAENLQHLGIHCEPYHSKIPGPKRTKTLEDFRRGILKIVVCTIAFGMGIDRRDVRLVLHFGMPRSIEGYYQEAGRAGRDGKPSKCILFYNYNDYVCHIQLITNPNHGERRKGAPPPSAEFMREQKILLGKMLDFVRSTKCRRIGMLEYLGAEPSEYQNLTVSEKCCDNCINALKGGTLISLNDIYEDISENGTYDYTDDFRKLLNCLNRHDIRQTTQMLVGIIPDNPQNCDLKLLGIGRDKSIDYWNNLYMVAKNCLFFDHTLYGLSVAKKAKSYIRNKSQNFQVMPPEFMRKFLKKKENVEFYWKGDKIESRQKFSDCEMDEMAAIKEMLSFEVEDEFEGENRMEENHEEVSKTDEEILKTAQVKKNSQSSNETQERKMIDSQCTAEMKGENSKSHEINLEQKMSFEEMQEVQESMKAFEDMEDDQGPPFKVQKLD